MGRVLPVASCRLRSHNTHKPTPPAFGLSVGLAPPFVRLFPIHRNVEKRPQYSVSTPDAGDNKLNCRPVLSG